MELIRLGKVGATVTVPALMARTTRQFFVIAQREKGNSMSHESFGIDHLDRTWKGHQLFPYGLVRTVKGTKGTIR